VSSVIVRSPYWKLLVTFATCGISLDVSFDGPPGTPVPVGRPRRPRPKKAPRRITAPRRGSGLSAQAEFLDQRPVAGRVLAMQVVEQAAATVDHLQQATTAVVVLLVRLEVLGQVHDAGGEQRHLDFRRAGVVGAARVFFDDLLVVDGHDCLVVAKPAEAARRIGTLRRTAWFVRGAGAPPRGNVSRPVESA